MQFTPEEINNGKGMSVLAYLGILVFIPLLASRENRYVMFHTGQGLALFIFSIAAYFIFIFVDGIFINFVSLNICGGSIIYFFIKIFIFVLVILGIINAVQGKASKLPVIGDIGEKFNLVK